MQRRSAPGGADLRELIGDAFCQPRPLFIHSGRTQFRGNPNCPLLTIGGITFIVRFLTLWWIMARMDTNLTSDRRLAAGADRAAVRAAQDSKRAFDNAMGGPSFGPSGPAQDR